MEISKRPKKRIARINIGMVRRPRTPALYLYGKTTVGKTHIVTMMNDLLVDQLCTYKIESYGYWENWPGDNGCHLLWLDEFKPVPSYNYKLTIQELNSIIEGARLVVNIKNGHGHKKQNKPVIILSNYHPDEAWKDFKHPPEVLKAFRKRLLISKMAGAATVTWKEGVPPPDRSTWELEEYTEEEWEYQVMLDSLVQENMERLEKNRPPVQIPPFVPKEKKEKMERRRALLDQIEELCKQQQHNADCEPEEGSSTTATRVIEEEEEEEVPLTSNKKKGLKKTQQKTKTTIQQNTHSRQKKVVTNKKKKKKDSEDQKSSNKEQQQQQQQGDESSGSLTQESAAVDFFHNISGVRVEPQKQKSWTPPGGGTTTTTTTTTATAIKKVVVDKEAQRKAKNKRDKQRYKENLKRRKSSELASCSSSSAANSESEDKALLVTPTKDPPTPTVVVNKTVPPFKRPAKRSKKKKKKKTSPKAV